MFLCTLTPILGEDIQQLTTSKEVVTTLTTLQVGLRNHKAETRNFSLSKKGHAQKERWWFQGFFFIPKIGEMIQFDGCIFFKEVGSTTN